LHVTADFDGAVEYLKNETAQGSPPLLVLFGPGLDNPLGAARRIHQISPESHLVFLADANRLKQLSHLLSPVAAIGTHWSVASPGSESLASVIAKALRSARQRQQLRTTLDRMNVRLASQASGDIGERRRHAVSDRFLASILENARDAIIATDHLGVINTLNHAAEGLFGVSEKDVAGQPIHKIAEGEWTVRLLELVTRLRDGLQVDGRREITCVRLDGNPLDVELALAPVRETSGRTIGYSAIVRDITDRKRAEQRILDSLREKEVLLKEIHHRVKNNLAVISSLFYLQSTYTHDEQCKRIFRESQDRVRSMALVHETLYRSERLADVDFAEYARVLADHLFRSHSVVTGVRLKLDLSPIRMSIDVAVPCGLILNELMSNALKHAFRAGCPGEIMVSLCTIDGERCVLAVGDDGAGIPSDLDTGSTQSLGLRLIHSLTGQLHGKFELLANNPGTLARVTVEVSDGSDKR
jgi:PAS domain S-box-containing protein